MSWLAIFGHGPQQRIFLVANSGVLRDGVFTLLLDTGTGTGQRVLPNKLLFMREAPSIEFESSVDQAHQAKFVARSCQFDPQVHAV